MNRQSRKGAHKGAQAGGNVRLLRVGESVRHALAGILARDIVHDPDLEGVVVTVSEVRVSPDLRHATVYVLPLLDRNSTAVIAALNRSAAFIRGQLAGAVRMKYLPQLRFQADDSFDSASRVEALLADPRVRRDLDSEEGEG